MAHWVFAKLDPAAVRREPNETQLFKSEQAGEDEYAGTDALVREILQNSLDAGTNGSSVRVRLALHTSDELPEESRLRDYFHRLESPLKDREVEFSNGVPNLPNGFMVCEDFGTRGLGGDPLLSRDPQPGSKDRQDFFWFWRNIGRSGKTGDDLGRWGLGKTVYRAASRVGCMLGLTVRECDKKQLLLGQSVLGIHDVSGTEYVPEGYWCGDTNAEGLPLPVEDSASLDQFRSGWKLTRTNEPGLSVVVPYVASELTGKRIMQAVCIHFFVPILRNELVVELAAPDLSMGKALIDADSLKEWCAALKWDGRKRDKRHVPPPVDFVKKCLAHDCSPTQTRVLGQKRMPEMNKEAFEEAELKALQEQLEQEDLVAVSVRINLVRQKESDVSGDMTVFLKRHDNEQRFDTYYVREGMTITKLNSKAGLKGIQALVLVDKGPLAQLLGDAEGPAHEDWDTSEERPNKLWKKWKGRVTFCRKVVDALLEVLAPPTQKADFNLLSDFFSIEKTGASQKAPAKGDNNNKAKSKIGEITAKPRWYRLDGKRGGFRIVPSSATEMPDHAELMVSVAYDVPTGNPLKKWSSFDFDFKQKPAVIEFSGKQMQAKTTSGNSIRLKIQDAEFSFAASGFDRHTDLFVRIDELGEDESDEESEEAP